MEVKQFYVEVIEVVENEDGSVMVVFDMDSEVVYVFFSLGVLCVIEVGFEVVEEV